MNQWQNPLKRETGSNLVDVGWTATHVVLFVGAATPTSDFRGRLGGHEESLRRTRGEVAGEELGTEPVDRLRVNVGTISRSPNLPHGQCGRGRARCRPMVSGWDGVLVVVRGRESRPHGEGAQRVSSDAMAMAGDQR